jgi:alpha-galactosidase
MPIIYDATTRTFFLHTPASTYALALGPLGTLLHLYWGASLRGGDLRGLLSFENRPFSPNPDPGDRSLSFDALPLEYPTFGRGDFRSPALEIVFENGTRITEFVYRSHLISKGKEPLAGLPSTYVENPAEAFSLEIDLVDKLSNLEVTLRYCVYEKWDAITRSVTVRNGGISAVKLERVLSASVDLPGARWDFIRLPGAWTRERKVFRSALTPGLQSVESRRGASSHQQHPFIALADPHTTESQGEVRGFSLVYSGNFVAQVEVDQFETARVQIGINPFEFSWELMPGEQFQSPEVVMVFSNAGLNGMSQVYHELYRNRLCRGRWRDKERPILINNWEATYFDFSTPKLQRLARQAKKAGIEMLVLDDGWFGSRDSEAGSLGDWTPHLKKLPAGLADLSQKIHAEGLKFGLWFEPEMISPDSDLYRAHPDWCLHVPDRARSQSRCQLVLDLARSEVCEWMVQTVGTILSRARIDYVKWDMNRHMTEVGSPSLPAHRQGETAHRYMLGLYSVLERLTQKFPKVLFEGCSGGGGRFDPGMLYYMPQIWVSDNTDAICRLESQYGTSLIYPLISMTSHVSAVPNHQVGRITSLPTRGDVAMAGNFGYELDLGRLSSSELKGVAAQVIFYKKHRRLIQFGRFYRLISPFEENGAAWMVVSPDRQEALVWYIQRLSQPNSFLPRLRLTGLDPKANYRWLKTRQIFGGDVLQEAGVPVSFPKGDFQSQVWEFKAV